MISKFAFFILYILFLFLIYSCGKTEHGQDTSESHYVGKYDPKKKGVIIFVHGLTGDAKDTWTAVVGNDSIYFPSLVSSDSMFVNYNVYVFDYLTSLSDKDMFLYEIQEEMELIFNKDKVDKHENIIFVAHSMGGLLTREFLINQSKVYQEKTKLLLFYATPTQGSSWANLLSMFPGTKQVRDIGDSNRGSYLDRISEQWSQFSLDDIPAYSFYETAPYLKIAVIVDKKSAKDLSKKTFAIRGSDHVSIVKPEKKTDLSYLYLSRTIDMTVSRIMREEARSDSADSKLLTHIKTSVTTYSVNIDNETLSKKLIEKLRRQTSTYKFAPSGSADKVISLTYETSKIKINPASGFYVVDDARVIVQVGKNCNFFLRQKIPYGESLYKNQVEQHCAANAEEIFENEIKSLTEQIKSCLN